MGEILQARVCAWCFNMQLRADPNDVSEYFRNILHDAQISSKIQLDMVSFAWSPDANGSLVDISGFIRAHRQVRGGAIDEWIIDERIPDKVAWKPCDGEKGKDWTSHPLIAQYLNESGSDCRTREFWKWNAESSSLLPCAGMPNGLETRTQEARRQHAGCCRERCAVHQFPQKAQAHGWSGINARLLSLGQESCQRSEKTSSRRTAGLAAR